MVLLAGALQQRLVGRVLDQRMLEAVRRLRRQPLLVQELRLHQLVQSPVQGVLVPRGDGLQQFIGKLAPQRRPELRQALHRRQAIQPRHQRVVQRGGNRQRGQGPGQLVALLPLLEQPGLQHHLGQLFDKQRHPIGLGHHLLDHLGGQRLAVRHPAGHLRGLAPRQAIERHLGEVRAPRPGRAEVGPTGEQRQDAGGGALVDQEAEQLQRGRIDPVQVFHDEEHRLLGGDPQQDRQEGVQRLLLLLLGRHGQGGIVGGQRQGEEGGEEGHGLRQRQAILHQEPLQFAAASARGTPPARSAAPPAPADRSSDTRRCAGNRANTDTASATPGARLATCSVSTCTRRDLPMPASPLSSTTCPRPSLTCAQRSRQQPDLLLAPHQGGQAGAAGDFQATAGRALTQHLIDLQRLRRRLSGVWAPSDWQAKKPPSSRKVAALITTRIRRRQPLQAGGQVGRLAEGQLFLSAAAPDLAHHHQPGMDPQAHGELHPTLLRQAGIELSQASTIPSPARTARWASSSWARG